MFLLVLLVSVWAHGIDVGVGASVVLVLVFPVMILDGACIFPAAHSVSQLPSDAPCLVGALRPASPCPLSPSRQLVLATFAAVR